MKNITLTTLIALCLSVCLANQAMAEEADLLDTLLNNGVITQEQYERLKKQQQAQESEAPEPAAPVTPQAGPPGVVVTPTGGLRGRTSDGTFTFRLGGRLMVDAAYYDEDLGNGTELRRARIFLEGTAWNDWGFKVAYGFGENDLDIKQAYIEYTGFDPLTLRIGQYKVPFSLEEQTSSLFLTFMERALPNAFAPDFSLGIGALTYGDNWTFSTGVFSSEGGDDLNSSDEGEKDEGYSIAGRFNYAPIAEESRVLHVGASAIFFSTDDDDEVRFRSRPESHITSVRFVNTDNISDVDDTLTYGAEALVVFGPFSVQGEYIRTDVNRSGGFSDLDFDGYYVYGSWFLTGEYRTYSARTYYRYERGELGRIKPRGIVGKGGIGAWEIAARYSKLDLNDGSGDNRINGGKEENITLGLNWYATPTIRFMFNYINVDTDGKEEDIDDPNIFQVRGQIWF